MRKTVRTLAVAIVLAAVALPVTATAQDATEQEAVQIQIRLMQAQQQALQDPEMQAAHAEVTEQLFEVMERVDPEVTQKAARAEALEAEAIAAQQAEDHARLQELAAEAQQLQAEFAVLQQQAMQDPQLQATLSAFQERMVAKMTEIEPETPLLLARLEALQGGG